MRPNGPPDAAMPRSRKTSAGDASRPTTYILTRDPELFSSNSESAHKVDTSPLRHVKDSFDEALRRSKCSPSQHSPQNGRSGSRRRSTIRPQPLEDYKPPTGTITSGGSSQPISAALTPLLLSSRDTSLPSSPKSVSTRSLFRSEDGSVAGDANSQAIASSEDEQEEADDTELTGLRESAPQLIMPSIKMPSRRPFTSRGKQIGKFKILIAGSRGKQFEISRYNLPTAAGSGRTSLIKSIVQLCDDIVHVDPLQQSTVSRPLPDKVDQYHNTTEVYASTRPYPSWWSEMEDSRILNRRKSVGDAILERNICFVDTKDVGKTEKVLAYVERQFFASINTIHQPGKELIGLLGGSGGSQVDLVLYLMTNGNWKHDCDQIRRLSQLCNVIPLIARSDLLTATQISDMKASHDLGNIGITRLLNEHSTQIIAPYSVSSANGPDVDNMDASLLMSPEYVQPLLPSELGVVIQQIFDPDINSYLRHTTAKKLVAWYASEPRLTQIDSPSLPSVQQPSTLNSPVVTSLTNSGVLVPVTSEMSLNTSNSYALAKVADHAQREEYLAQVRLSKWATDLQLSLQRERERYENIARNERAVWLVQRMGEEVREGRVGSIDDTRAVIRSDGKRRYIFSDTARHELHDPLGLLGWQDAARLRGWIALQVLGSFGVVGGVALWLAKTWGLTTNLHGWAQEWTETWFA